VASEYCWFLVATRLPADTILGDSITDRSSWHRVELLLSCCFEILALCLCRSFVALASGIRGKPELVWNITSQFFGGRGFFKGYGAD
jgi:hypothetical protein